MKNAKNNRTVSGNGIVNPTEDSAIRNIDGPMFDSVFYPEESEYERVKRLRLRRKPGDYSGFVLAYSDKQHK